jgi:hypothetical protein
MRASRSLCLLALYLLVTQLHYSHAASIKTVLSNAVINKVNDKVSNKVNDKVAADAKGTLHLSSSDLQCQGRWCSIAMKPDVTCTKNAVNWMCMVSEYRGLFRYSPLNVSCDARDKCFLDYQVHLSGHVFRADSTFWPTWFHQSVTAIALVYMTHCVKKWINL